MKRRAPGLEQPLDLAHQPRAHGPVEVDHHVPAEDRVERAGHRIRAGRARLSRWKTIRSRSRAATVQVEAAVRRAASRARYRSR